MTEKLTRDELRRWRTHAGASPLYQHLIEVIASDEELMRVLNEIEHTPRPNVLFAGVQYLLMKYPTHELAAFYPNLTDDPSPLDAVDRPFQEFVMEHLRELLEIGRTRYTQTNEARRCAALLPAIWETPLTGFHLIDLGTSAGLTLLMDRYRYRWNGLEWGPDSPVVLECRLRGRLPSPRPVDISTRTGLDLNPLDLAEPDDRMWLDALIWPEQTDRRLRLTAAVSLRHELDIELVAGDAVETLGPTIATLPDHEPVVVTHSFAINQFRPEQREAVEEALAAARRGRDVWRVSMELLEWSDVAPTLTVDDGSGPTVVGQAQPHGEWLELFEAR